MDMENIANVNAKSQSNQCTGRDGTHSSDDSFRDSGSNDKDCDGFRSRWRSGYERKRAQAK